MTSIGKTLNDIDKTIDNLKMLRFEIVRKVGTRDQPNLSDMASIRKGVINMKKKSSLLSYKL